MSAFSNFLYDISGQQGNITVPRAYIKFCNNDHAMAMLLNQILYWQQRSKTSEFSKSYADWLDELMLTERQVRRATKELLAMEIGLTVTVKKSKYYGMRLTNHYSLNFNKFMKKLEAFYSVQTPLTKSKGYPDEMSGVNNNDYTSKLDNTNVLSPQDGFSQAQNPLAGSGFLEASQDNHDNTIEDDTSMWTNEQIKAFADTQKQLRERVGKSEPVQLVRGDKSITDSNALHVPSLHETQLLTLITTDQLAAIDLYMLSQGHDVTHDKLDALLHELGWRIKSGLSKAKAKRERINIMISKIPNAWVLIASQRLKAIEERKAQDKERRRGITDVLSVSPFNLVNGRLGKVTQAVMDLTPDKPVTGKLITDFVSDWQFRNKGISIPLGSDTLPTAILNYRDSQKSNSAFDTSGFVN